MMSLRQRLLMFLLLPLIPLSAFLIGMIYWAIRSATTESYDRVLEGSAFAIADRVVLEGRLAGGRFALCRPADAHQLC